MVNPAVTSSSSSIEASGEGTFTPVRGLSGDRGGTALGVAVISELKEVKRLHTYIISGIVRRKNRFWTK